MRSKASLKITQSSAEFSNLEQLFPSRRIVGEGEMRMRNFLAGVCRRAAFAETASLAHRVIATDVTFGKTGARGGSRTHMRKTPRRILSPQRLPFRHPGSSTSNLTNRVPHRNSTAGRAGCAKTRAISWLGATALFHQAGSVADESLQAIRRC